MAFFPNARNTSIYGGTFISSSGSVTYDLEQYALEELKRHSTGRAFHNSKARYDPPKCHPQTREAVFREIQEWLHITSAGKPILWIYGPAGAGKSAIAQSIAEKSKEMGYLLVASFFFSRPDGERNNAERLVPSIAYQMISSLPSTRPYVLKCINDHPQLFSLAIRTQLEILVHEPLLSANISSSDAMRMLILVDGLDECLQEDDRMEFLHAMKEVFSLPSFPLALLCSSRPESDIRGAFNDSQLAGISDRIVLDDHFNPSSDIEKFLIHEFAKVKASHPLKTEIPNNWPPNSTIQELVRKSSGQFIYASTVVKHVASRKHDPVEQLRMTLNLGSNSHASPFKELDALYHQILSSIPGDDRSIVVRILGLICVSKWLIKPSIMDSIFNLAPRRTILLLQDLLSLVDVKGNRDVIRPFHASLSDFLTDRSRSRIYYVDPIILEADTLLLRLGRNLFRIRSNLDPEHLSWNENLALLTNELYEYLLTFPWADILPEGGIQEYIFSHDARFQRKRIYLVFYALDVYDFCKWVSHLLDEIRVLSVITPVTNQASKISPERWGIIQTEAMHAFSLWIAREIHGLPSAPELDDFFRICILFQGSWKHKSFSKAWAWRLYGQTFLRTEGGRFRRLECMIRLVLRKKALSGLLHINRVEHHHILYNGILYYILRGLPSTTCD